MKRLVIVLSCLLLVVAACGDGGDQTTTTAPGPTVTSTTASTTAPPATTAPPTTAPGTTIGPTTPPTITSPPLGGDYVAVYFDVGGALAPVSRILEPGDSPELVAMQHLLQGPSAARRGVRHVIIPCFFAHLGCGYNALYSNNKRE